MTSLFQSHKNPLVETKRRVLVALVMVLGLSLFVFVWWSSTQAKKVNPVNPYEQYALALQTPSPKNQTSAFIQALHKIEGIKGWTVVSVVFQGETGRALLKSSGGSTTQLLTLSQSKGMTVNFLSTGATLNFSTPLQNRKLSENIVSTQKTVATIMRRLNSLLPKNAIVVNQTVTNPVFKKIDMVISFNNVSPELIGTIGAQLDDLPVNINSISADLKKGLLSGNLNMSVVGN